LDGDQPHTPLEVLIAPPDLLIYRAYYQGKGRKNGQGWKGKGGERKARESGEERSVSPQT